MQIRIKTAAEFRDAHVTIEVRAADEDEAAMVAERLDGRLYTAREVGDAQASEAELVSAPLRRKLAEETERADRLNERNANLVVELAEQRERADANQAWAERAESRVAATGLKLAEVAATGLKLADAEREIEILSDQLRRISSAVHEPEIAKAVSVARSWDRKEPRVMAEAIRQVRDALGSPSLPASPDSSTSQT